jgi:PAS domain S-box-containing protein
LSLRTKTSILLALILIVSIGVTGVFHLRLLEDSLRGSVLSGLESTTHTAALLVSKFLEDSLNAAHIVADALPKEAIERRDSAQVEARLKTFLDIFPKFENGMFILDPQGQLWADYPAHSGLRGTSFAHREYFQKTMAQGMGIIGLPYRSARTGRPVLTVTALLKSDSGHVLGVLGCSVQLTSPLALGGIRLTRIGRSGYLYIYDATRMMILHPDEARILKRDVPAGANRLFDLAIEGFEGSGETVNSRGVAMLLSLRRVPGIDWILGAQLPQEEAFAPLKDARDRILLALAAAVTLSVLVGTLAVRGITRPLERLRRAALMLGAAPRPAAPEAAEQAQRKEAVVTELERIGGGGEIGVLAATFREISGRLDSTLASLRRAASDWSRTFDTVPDAVFILDGDQKIQRLNRAAADLTRMDPPDLLGRPIHELVAELPPDDPATKEINRCFPGKPSVARLLHGGSNAILEASATPLLDEAGVPIGSVWVGKDITSRVSAEAENRRLEERLQLAQKMEAIGTLAGGIAHDFNNILAAIMGNTEIALLELTRGSGLQPHLEAVLKASERARDLIRQILTFSRRSQGELKPMKLAPLIDEALKLLRASLPATVQVQRRITSRRLVMADATQIHQVLMNLCTNAGQAMREKGGLLEVSLTDVDAVETWRAEGPPAPPTVRLAVRDTGRGMAPEIIPRVFEPFFSTKPCGEGTGMGLAVVHGIVKDHGGSIAVESAPGSGSLFQVDLPAIEMQAAEAPDREEALVRGRGHLLLVDDEAHLVAVSKAMLERLGYTVTTRTSGAAALELFKARPQDFDLIVSDMTMPGITGTELAAQAMALRPGLPVIICTGYSEAISEEIAAAMGIRGLLMKPVAFHDFARAVSVALHPN